MWKGDYALAFFLMSDRFGRCKKRKNGRGGLRMRGRICCYEYMVYTNAVCGNRPQLERSLSAQRNYKLIVNLPWVLSFQCVEFLDTIMLVLWFLLNDSLKSTSKVMLAYTCQYNGGEGNQQANYDCWKIEELWTNGLKMNLNHPIQARDCALLHLPKQIQITHLSEAPMVRYNMRAKWNMTMIWKVMNVIMPALFSALV